MSRLPAPGCQGWYGTIFQQVRYVGDDDGGRPISLKIGIVRFWNKSYSIHLCQLLHANCEAQMPAVEVLFRAACNIV